MLSLYPLRRLEVQLIHVPEMRIDPSVEENFRAFAARRGSGQPYANGEEENSVFPEAEDYDLSAVRAVWYGNRFTLGVTFFDGANMLFDPQRQRFLTDQCGGDDVVCWRDDRGLAYAETETLGIELAVPLGRGWTLRAETAEITVMDDLAAVYDADIQAFLLARGGGLGLRRKNAFPPLALPMRASGGSATVN